MKLISLALVLTALHGSGVDPELNDRIDVVLREGVTRDRVEELYWAAVRDAGDVDDLLISLSDRRLVDDVDPALVRAVREAEAHVYWRRGDMDLATAVLDALVEEWPDDDGLVLWRAQLYDAAGRVKDAEEGYQKALEMTDDPRLEREIRLRLAMMGLMGGRKEDQDALAGFARAHGDTDLRNRAAIVLAVLDRHQDAIGLFVVEGEGAARFKQSSRVAEWAIRADDAEKAKASAWDAVKSAALRRDRRYALSLLVEAHRLDDTLPALIERFAAEDSLTDEEREVWIETLRDIARYDEAIALFQASSEGEFSVEMRRELLEMEREAGREDRMIETYRSLVDSEPDVLAWRAGLTQVLLERGDQEDAEALWPEYVAGLTSGAMLLSAANVQADLGLDTLAETTIERMLELDVETGPGLLFLASIHRDRGRLDESEATLDQLNGLAEASHSVRFDLAETYEQLGRQKKAVEVMEGIRAARETVAEDLEMRLAWLYSEIGEEEKALDHWVDLWRRINSVPRRRYVEDRMMSVASRLGKLADIAIEMEEKLLDGSADEREAGLLVRIYTRVNDPVSATEVLGDSMKQQGVAQIEALAEKARIYFICKDYHNYEKTIRSMIDVDPEGKGEYLRQLAMSQLERGRADEAREVLLQLRDLEVDNVSREFEAGVLTLAGMRDEAAEAYRKGIAEFPDRIESYLLLANLMRDLGQTRRAVGMFQFLAETADRDDLFTIAVDGLLNMEADRNVIEWARRITLERLAGREDKNYLYQLLTDLAEEAGDKDGQIRALENSIAISGTRRLSVLRECMDLSSNIRGGVFYAPGRGPTNAGNKKFYAFGRRLIGLQEAVPPQVFLDLGKAFLEEDDVRSASRTFSLARNLPDERSYRREVAGTFEEAKHRQEALRVYERLLRVSPSDIGLIAKVAQLHEQEGRDDVANRFYRQGLDLLIRQAPLTTLDRDGQAVDNRFAFYWARNTDAYQQYYDRIIRGLLVTLPDAAVLDELLEQHRTALESELEALAAEIEAGVEIEKLAGAPRITKRARALRRLLIAFDRVDDADAMDLGLLERFPEDEGLLRSFARTRVDWGYYDSARRLAERSGRDEAARRAVRVMLGEEYDETDTDPIAPNEAMRQLVPLLVAGDRDAARALLRRVELTSLGGGSAGHVIIINGVASFEANESAPATQFLRIAQRLEDPDLVLRFARGWMSSTIDSNQSPPGVVHVFQQALQHLDGDHQTSFCRFVADLVLEKPERHARYVGLLAAVGEAIEENQLDPETLLTAIDEAAPALGWMLPAVEFIEALPESIRSQATQRVIEKTPPGQRVAALLPVPFQVKVPLDETTMRIVRDHFVGDIVPAKDLGRLQYVVHSIPGGQKPVRVIENAEAALAILEAISEHIPPKEMDAIRSRRALIIRQQGKTDEAAALAVEILSGPEPARDAYTANQARRELTQVFVPEAPDAFFAAFDAEEEETGATVALTDRRLRMLRQVDDPVRARAEHLRAVETHPDEDKYLTQLERLDQRAGRLLDAIEVNRRIIERLEAKDGEGDEGLDVSDVIDAIVEHLVSNAGGAIDASAVRPGIERRADTLGLEGLVEMATNLGVPLPSRSNTAVVEAERRLGYLWARLENPVEGLEHWKVVERAEREKFEQAMAEAGERTNEGRPGAGETGSPESGPDAEDEKDEKDDMSTVRDAVEADDEARARRVLRRLWRTFPRDGDRPYVIYANQGGGVAGLQWPEEEAATEEEDDPTEEEKAEARAKARNRARGGLATFEPPEEKEPKETTSAWQVLAGHEFGVDEMHRVLRSRTAHEVRSIKPVILGLLEAERKQLGDESVREGLLAAVREGRAGQTSLIQLFALLNESPELIDADDATLLDDLVRTLEPGETRLLSRLAWLYAAIGETERATRLYVYCASRATSTTSRYIFWNPYASDQAVNMSTLVKEAQERFEGDALVALLEKLFDATPTRTNESLAVLAADTWTELLEPAEALERLRDYFQDLENVGAGLRRSTAKRGAKLYAQAGELDEARRCLRAAVRTYVVSELPPEAQWQYWGRTEITASLTVRDLFDLFPEDFEGFADPAGWLAAAASELDGLVEDDLLERSTSIRPMAVAALRLTQLGEADDAAEILDRLDGVGVADVGRADRLLLVDVARAAGRLDLVLSWQRSLHESQLLPAVRFADFVRDTAEADGLDAAVALLEALLAVSRDEELLAAAIELTAEERFTTLAAEAEAAKEQVRAIRERIGAWRKQVSEMKSKAKGGRA